MSNNLIPIENRSYVKSNDMISAKTKASLLENKLLAVAIAHIEENPQSKDNQLEARLYPSTLKKILSDDTHIYRDLKMLAKSITGRSMILEDGKGNFKAFAVIPSAVYENSVFTINFNSLLKDHLLNLDKNFTMYELSVMTNFSRNSSFRIYELLKRDIFRSKPNVNNGRVTVEYNLFEFRFLIGLANIENQYIQTRIKNMSVIDWEELYYTLEKYGTQNDIKYKATDKLQRDCLKPAQEELLEKSDIRFDYELVRIGRSYKRIVFHIYPNDPRNKKELRERQRYIEKINSKDYQYEIPRDMSEDIQKLYDKYVGHNELVAEDLDLLFKISGDPNDIAAAIEYTDTRKNVGNYVGYIIDTLKGRYFETEPIEVRSGSHEKALAYKEFDDAVHSDDTKKRVWDNIKKQEDFDVFLEYEEKEENLTFLELDELLPVDESASKYIKWRKLDLPGRKTFHVPD